MICKSLYLSNSCLFRQEARKLGVKVNIVSHNLGTEIRNELRWEEQKLDECFPHTFFDHFVFNDVMWSCFLASHEIRLDLKPLMF